MSISHLIEANEFDLFCKNIAVEEDIFVGGNIDIEGKIDIEGDIKIGGNVNVTGNIITAGNTYVDGELDVKGNINGGGDFEIVGNATINGDIIAENDVDIKNDLSVGGSLAISTISADVYKTSFLILTDQATINWDASLGCNAQVTLAGNRTLANPTNTTSGTLYTLTVVQDSIGGRTLEFGANFNFTWQNPGFYSSPTALPNSTTIYNFLCTGTTLVCMNINSSVPNWRAFRGNQLRMMADFVAQNLSSTVSACKIDDTRMFTAWRDAANNLYAKIITFDGAGGVNFGIESKLLDTPVVHLASYGCSFLLNNSQIVTSYTKSGSVNPSLYLVVSNFSGTTITPGTPKEVTTATIVQGATHLSGGAKLNSTDFVITYKTNLNIYALWATSDVSGVITLGSTPFSINVDVVNATAMFVSFPLTSTSIVAFYQTASGAATLAFKGCILNIVSNNVNSKSSEITISSTPTSQLLAGSIYSNNNSWVLAWQDTPAATKVINTVLISHSAGAISAGSIYTLNYLNAPANSDPGHLAMTVLDSMHLMVIYRPIGAAGSYLCNTLNINNGTITNLNIYGCFSSGNAAASLPLLIMMNNVAVYFYQESRTGNSIGVVCRLTIN